MLEPLITIGSINKNKRPVTSYRGRFAPSPSGLLHFGSLVSALASFLQAKSQQGTWLVRIEDIDPPRELEGASNAILQTLEAYGLHWDESVLYQSQQHDLYLDVLAQLKQQKLTYHCQCTRAQIKALGGIYQGHCKNLTLSEINSTIRLINNAPTLHYHDLIQGTVQCDRELAQEDFTIKRKDGLFAYQLAVVVDDIYQGITEVIRGCDLLEPTARQLSFFELLRYPAPKYGHVPLAVTNDGYKLSKQNNAPAIDNKNPQPALIAALQYLGQSPTPELIHTSVNEIISWAISHWHINKVPKTREIPLI